MRPSGTAASDADLVRAAWNLERLAEMYRDFVERYQPVLAQLRDGAGDSGDESAFLLRMLLIHDYRRLLLRDPGLPDVLLASDWPGQRARLLCRELYRRLLAPSERHLDAHLQLADGHAPRGLAPAAATLPGRRPAARRRLSAGRIAARAPR